MKITQKQLHMMIDMCIRYICISVIILEILSILQIVDRYMYITDFEYKPGVINAVNWEKIPEVDLPFIHDADK